MADERAAERIRSGPLALEVARFGTPLALGMGLQTSFNLVDAYIVSRLDAEVAGPALGAIGICDQIAALGTILSYGISIGTAAIMTRRHGAGDDTGMRRIAWQSMLLVGTLGAIFLVFGVLGARATMIDLIGAKGEVAELGTRYLRVMVGGNFTIFFLLHLTTIQRALGSSKTPITFLVIANALNLVLATVLVYGPGNAPWVFSWGPPIAHALGIPRLELMGAAWATVAARAVVLLPLAVLVARRFGVFRAPSREPPQLGILRSILDVAWPSSAQLVVRIAAMLFVHSLVARAYTTEADQTATTALGIVFRLETMALFVGLGWGSAAQTFMGQNLGAERRARAKASGWYAAAYNALMMALLAIAYGAWGTEIVTFFDDRPAVVATGLDYIACVSPSYVGLGIGIVLASAIQGSGATRRTLALDSAVVFLLQVPASCVVVFVVGAEPTRLWQTVAATYVAFAIVYAISYRRGAYLDVKLPDPEAGTG